VACEQLAPTECVKRHDGVAKVNHQKLVEAAKLIEDKSDTLATILENDNFKLNWNRSIITEKTISSNRPYITFMNKKKNTFLIDIAVPNTHNLAKTIIDKQNKYQELVQEICAMWKQNAAQMIPIVISSMGVIPKSLSQSLKRLNLHPNTNAKICNSRHMFNCKKLSKP
jgi:hypothetical protein